MVANENFVYPSLELFKMSLQIMCTHKSFYEKNKEKVNVDNIY